MCLGSQPQIKEVAFIFGKIHQILLLYSDVLKPNARLDAAFTDCWPFKTVLKWALACGWIRNQSINLQNENRLLKVAELTSNGIWINFLLFIFIFLQSIVFTSNRFRTPHQSDSVYWSKVVLSSVRRTSVHGDTTAALLCEGICRLNMPLWCFLLRVCQNMRTREEFLTRLQAV